MAKSQDLEDFGQIIEKIIFEENELEELKIAIKNFTEGKTSAKELKHFLLQCRGRMTEDITYFTSLFVEQKTQDLLKTVINKDQLPSPTKLESQLREEIKEKNDLLEIVAKRVNKLVSKLNNEDSSKNQKPISISIDDAKKEIKRSLNQIGAKQWIEMCYYEDYKFFVKLYPKLEELYHERFGESEKMSNSNEDGKEIMPNKMVRLGFPKNIETVVIKYISVRNNFHHSMVDISPSNLELAHKAFVKLFVYLIISNLDSKLLSNNRESFYSCLKEFFSERLTDNTVFRKRILERLKTVFYI